MALRDEELRDRLQTTSGGSSETELKELTVRPTGGMPSGAAVITVTPVGNRPSAALKKDESKEGEVAFMLGRNPSDRPLSRGGGLVGQAVVQPRRPPLPKLEVLGLESIAAPVGGARRLLVAVLLFECFFGRGKLLERNRTTLGRGPSADL